MENANASVLTQVQHVMYSSAPNFAQDMENAQKLVASAIKGGKA